MNRHDRRLLARRHSRNGRGPVPLCAPGTHAYGELVATVKGEAAATRIVCQNCRRTFEQVMEESPRDLEIYRDWLTTERAAASTMHTEACPRRRDSSALFVERCPGCAREQQLGVSDKEAGHP